MISIKRIYDPPKKTDGLRILVDRIWPRGVKKSEAQIDLWLKEIAPSTELRRWFSHDEKKWKDFQKRYRAELSKKRQQMSELTGFGRKKKLTLLYSAKDEKHNQAVVLKNYLERICH